MRSALVWSVIWTGLGLAFGALVLAFDSSASAGEYVAGFLIEKSLSLDNLFVFAVLFSFFAVPQALRQRVLVLGIAGAIVLRVLFIVAGGEGVGGGDGGTYGGGAGCRARGHLPARRAAAVHRVQDRPAGWRGGRPGEDAGDAGYAPRAAPEPGLRRLEAVHPRRRPARGHAADGRLSHDRRVRRHVRDRLDPGDLRHHAGHVHRLRGERLQPPRHGQPVLPARRAAGPLPLPQRRPGGDPRLRRGQTDPRRRLAPADRPVPGGRGRLADRRGAVLGAGGAARGGHRGPPPAGRGVPAGGVVRRRRPRRS